MPKSDKRDINADKKEKEEKRIYLDGDQPKLTEMIAASIKSSKKAEKSDVDTKLKEIVEKAKENDPNKSKAPSIFQYKPLRTESELEEIGRIETAQIVSEQKKSGDGLRLVLFAGVMIGFLMLLSLFGGAYSPLAFLGFMSKPVSTEALANNSIVIPIVEDIPVNDTIEVTKPEVKIAEPTKVDVVISNYKMNPSQINAKVGEKIVLQITAAEMPFEIIIEELGINQYVNPGEPISIAVTPSAAGSYFIHAIASSAGRMVEATGTLVVE